MPVMYKGFSTVYNQGNKKYSLTSYDLIKQDLLNALNTRKGSRVMNPNEGTIIWDIVFEPLTEETQQALVQDITNIVAKDPRLSVSNIDINAINNSVYLTLDLVYVSDNVADTMRIRFDNASLTATFQ
jgi:phage baseplate assembly protein W